MKIFSIVGLSTLCCVLLATIIAPIEAQAGSTCTADYECGIPYGTCSGSSSECTSTLQGIAVDSSSSDIYYGAVCNNNVTIKKVSASGGASTTIYSEAQLREGGNVGTVLHAVVNGYLYISRIERMPGQALVTFNLATFAQTVVTLEPGFFESELDIVNGNSYSCQLSTGSTNNYTIERYSGVVGQTASSNGLRLYTLGDIQCGPVRRGTGADIFFTGVTITPSSTTTTFYKGSVTGSKSLPSPYFVVGANVFDFAVDFSTGDIVYGSSTGLYKRSTAGETTTLYSGSEVPGVVIYNSQVYFNDGTTIRSVSLTGGQVQQILQPTTGTCKCISLFTGSDCETCNGQVQWSNSGVPSCVALNAAGIPEYCSYDYQCGNVPYTFCDGSSCSCRPNFTGAACDQCASSITWSNGIPSCA